ncbi:3-hydroxyacyl-CoA dehydrogenase NAD-binding domain-containing protein [Pseudomonas sp. AN-1]|uniref:3-hydroxyacyl-CoA dehydrogenase NAD-binding domain-containing protein n=1 Tax=Pseudomonas sp. AN-1 TaxID=3096605 RepID=UPI002A6B8B72|nr:3-hydroxyacyl-CoA dehydrogenase NAD-binding domain-containing protein [Pseudomonas sp. AN-1]WPP46539.1 3-hydroxyacyl-CoA dehydrogenase NAD-binding domain-containing protein [Pseudomonas sp. AN-1]
MYTLIDYTLDNELALIGLARAPVNALGLTLRQELQAAFRQASADPAVKAMVVYGRGLPFCAGADIAEFGGADFTATPGLPELLIELAGSAKPMIAAVGGLALGGGLELAMACGYRIGEPKARLGMPEITLGLLPGAGGTQRLPRLIGAETALETILSGQPLRAERALELGLLDRLADSAEVLLDTARSYARELLEENAPAFPDYPHAAPGAELPAGFFTDYTARKNSQWKGQLAPHLALEAVRIACEQPLAVGLAREQELFMEAMDSPQSQALRHLFFAEREAGKVPGIDASLPLRPIKKVAVIGAGTMGGGIAMNFANIGMPVVLLEQKREALDRGLAQIRKNYEISAKRGKLTQEQVEQRMALLAGTLDYADLADADLVIEAVFESMEVKRQVFVTLDEICKPGAILATNTSTLDVDQIAAFTRRPQDVIGLHFFSPANVMRLLEVVRGKQTALDVLATALKLGKQIGKLPVVSGVCYGFIGNRMLEPYAREAHRLLLEGATPAQVDRVLTDLGLNMGVLSMYDLVGIDVGYLIRTPLREALATDPSYYRVADELYALGRYGQKTGRGMYIYEGRERHDDPEVLAMAERLAAELGIQRRVISDQEIHDRCLFVLINEGIQILDEGIALRAGDIDLVWTCGYGFPTWLGGPLHYAEHLGLERVLGGLNQYREQLGAYGEQWFKPAALLERLVAAGKTRISKD